jgi:hypothetical protein
VNNDVRLTVRVLFTGPGDRDASGGALKSLKSAILCQK